MQYAVLATKLVYGLISYCTHTKRPSNIFCNVDHCQVSCIKLRHCLHCHWRVFNINCRMAGYHIHVWLDGISSTSCTKCCLRCHWLYIYTPSPRVYNAPVKVSPRLPQAGDYRGLGLRNWRKCGRPRPPGTFWKENTPLMLLRTLETHWSYWEELWTFPRRTFPKLSILFVQIKKIRQFYVYIKTLPNKIFLALFLQIYITRMINLKCRLVGFK